MKRNEVCELSSSTIKPQLTPKDKARLRGLLRTLSGRLNRRPLRGTFFATPVRLYDSGLVHVLKPSAFIRYCTLLRLANFSGSRIVSASHEQLRKLDKVSRRAAWLVDRKLNEFGLVEIEKLGRAGAPFVYVLRHPEEWNLPALDRPRIVAVKPLQIELSNYSHKERFWKKEKENRIQLPRNVELTEVS